MFKSMKRSVLIILAVVIFTAGVIVGSGRWDLVTEAAVTWDQAVADVVDTQKVSDYISCLLPENMDVLREKMRDHLGSLVEKILSYL